MTEEEMAAYLDMFDKMAKEQPWLIEAYILTRVHEILGAYKMVSTIISKQLCED